ncbi:MAG: RagB/SusD family nutrient uptake outer membrane protein [Tannerella sp.]|jgi:hypothetical protein|nr:RagB/SusD family nutrient uptake outer membrane protein [Tannerella sp.]
MKRNNVYIKMMLVAAMICGCFACDDEFLERYPQTSVAVPTFFKSVSDLQLYVNGLYSVTPKYYDPGSDNVTFARDVEPYSGMLYGRLTPDNVSGWDWAFLRNVNLMLNNLDEVSGEATEINHYVGIARYLRARFYIEKVQTYSNVPWYDKELTTTDEDLYKTQDPRAFVVDKIMEDLEFAVVNIKPDMGNRTRVHKYVALAELSRFALYEGTYRKYHTELELTGTANRFLERAVSASEEIMNSGNFELTGIGTEELAPGITGSAGFRALFSSATLDGNREIIQWCEYGLSPYRKDHSACFLTAASTIIYSLNRSLQESFLTKDGKPFSTVADYDKKEYKDVFTDRDPRMAETFVWPGLGNEDAIKGITPLAVPPRVGGYMQSKYFTPKGGSLKSTDNTWQATSLPVFRYGEVLLNYAEAKAELGQLDATAVGKSINLLRARVNMPAFNASVEVDATLRSLYPGVSDVNILAVRRERRVELAGEGLRQQDIYRWKAGKLYEAEISQQGIYTPSLPYAYDTNSDGIPDQGVAETASKHTDDPAVAWYDIDAADIEIYRDASGFIRIKNDQTRKFDEPKCYYTPIPKGQIVLNPNLKQPPGW